MKILIISPDLPYPPNHGGRVDIWNRIKLLSKLNHEVDIAITSNEEFTNTADREQFYKYIGKAFFFPRKIKFLQFILGVPYQTSSRSSLEKFRSDTKYDIVILESESTSSILNSPSIKNTKILLRIHNNESQYFSALFKSTKQPIKKAYYLYESLAYKRHTKKIKARSDAILHISSEELAAEKSENISKSFFLPPYINLDSLKEPSTSDNSQVLFVGNLFTPNNINGLQWYLDEVHQKLLTSNKDYELVIAGNTKGKKIALTNLNQPRIRLYDSPANLDELYKTSTVFIIPLLEGAGVKLRAVNAISEGIAIVSTSSGIEGLNLKDGFHFSLGNTSEAFFQAINRLLKSKTERTNLVQNAQQHMIENLNSLKILSKILTAN